MNGMAREPDPEPGEVQIRGRPTEIAVSVTFFSDPEFTLPVMAPQSQPAEFVVECETPCRCGVFKEKVATRISKESEIDYFPAYLRVLISGRNVGDNDEIIGNETIQVHAIETDYGQEAAKYARSCNMSTADSEKLIELVQGLASLENGRTGSMAFSHKFKVLMDAIVECHRDGRQNRSPEGNGILDVLWIEIRKPGATRESVLSEILD